MKNTPASKGRVLRNLKYPNSASKDTNNSTNSAHEYSLEVRTSKTLPISDLLPSALKHLQPKGGVDWSSPVEVEG